MKGEFHFLAKGFISHLARRSASRSGSFAQISKVFSNFLPKLLKDESGQGTVEYVLILSATVIGAAAISRAVIGALDKGILHMGAILERDLKTGKAPLYVWEN